VDFPSCVGVLEEYTEKMDEGEAISNGVEDGKEINKKQSQKKYFIDTMSIKTPRPHKQIQSFLKDGLIEDWDIFDNVLDYMFMKHLRCEPSKHPILMSEPVVNKENRKAYFYPTIKINCNDIFF
jgi:actin-related protein